jgi:hypothetical protein
MLLAEADCTQDTTRKCGTPAPTTAFASRAMNIAYRKIVLELEALSGGKEAPA